MTNYGSLTQYGSLKRYLLKTTNWRFWRSVLDEFFSQTDHDTLQTRAFI